jgi:phosphohistidine phosphatase
MHLLVVRHGIAEDREEFAATGQDDSLRPLTAEGRTKMERNARALRRALGSVDALATSPLVRAAETATIVAAAFDEPPLDTVDALVPEAKPSALLPWLRRHDDTTTVAVVGHEPHLGTLVAWLVTGRAEPGIPLKKGGACLLEFDGRPDAGRATMLWMLTPGLMKKL